MFGVGFGGHLGVGAWGYSGFKFWGFRVKGLGSFGFGFASGLGFALV